MVRTFKEGSLSEMTGVKKVITYLTEEEFMVLAKVMISVRELQISSIEH